MNTHTHTNPSTALVGSISQVAHAAGMSEADAMLEAQVVVAMDTSISMGECDAGKGRDEERYTVACDELAVLQSQRPGQIVVMSWSNYAIWCADGVPVNQQGGTDIVSAIRAFVDAGFDDLLTLTIMADGEVAEAQQKEAKRLVSKMKSKVNTIYIGNTETDDGKAGAKFLAELARVGRGKTATTIEPGMLAKPALLMIGAPATATGPGVINL